MKKLIYPLTLVALVTSLTACGWSNAVGPHRGPHTQNTTYQAGRTPANFNAMTYGTPGTRMMDHTGSGHGMTGYGTYGTTVYNHQLSDRIARAADAVPGVEGATAIVYGNDAVVGVNIRHTASPTHRRAIEKKVYAAAHAVAPSHQVRVTSDKRMLTRIQNIHHAFRSQYGHTSGYGNTGFGNTGFGNTGFGTGYGAAGYGTMRNGTAPFMGGPTTVAGNLTNAASDFGALIRDLGRTVTAPFR
ncbi:hypothetical protein G3578_00570 [Brevibacillus sp. SYP-B805]|uniref:YhcN/YlaJ family sporulation lipoprotein n=1 Tax=Brevibacillus sp. SYP-B805 TaxID=1578199 RepID=UPI0013EA035A|nr:YhcN/YlaJ family sporulation lipoprotein [Brevibacillus sp. SYP-B805]NGQ93661.1 hypothetical protein [Brevibacillus sp. SYP-B805]